MWSPDPYFKHLYDRVTPSERFQASSIEECVNWNERLRTRFVELLGGYPAKIPELGPVVIESVDCGTYTRERIQI